MENKEGAILKSDQQVKKKAKKTARKNVGGKPKGYKSAEVRIADGLESLQSMAESFKTYADNRAFGGVDKEALAYLFHEAKALDIEEFQVLNVKVKFFPKYQPYSMPAEAFNSVHRPATATNEDSSFKSDDRDLIEQIRVTNPELAEQVEMEILSNPE